MEAFFSILDRVYDLGARQQTDEAFALGRDVGIPARLKLNEWMADRAKAQADELAVAKTQATQQASDATYLLIALAGGGLVAAMMLAGLIIVFAVTRPLGSLVSVLQRMASGEIDASIAEARRGDEIGAVGRAVEGIKDMVARKAAEEAEVKRRADAAAAAERKRTMIELADGFERAVGGIVGLVSSSATELQATAQQMTATAQETASAVHHGCRGRRGGRVERQHGRGGGGGARLLGAGDRPAGGRLGASGAAGRLRRRSDRRARPGAEQLPCRGSATWSG